MHAWVVMPNHLHALFSLAADSLLEKQISSWKRFSAKEIHRRTDGAGPLWQEDYFDRMIRDGEHFGNVARYIARNPAKLRDGIYLAYQTPWV
jgi:REP element-mobilizing transposase RayT